MKNTIRTFLLAGLLALAAAAHAQRAPVPIMNFENIPVSLSTEKRLTVEQVRYALLAGGAAASWEMAQKSPNTLEATFRKGEKHTVVVLITYDAEKYSAQYVSSINMKYEDVQPVDPRAAANSGTTPSHLENAAIKQSELFAGQPETPYAKPAPRGVIHPFYERWVHDLFKNVRVQLKLAAATP
jgi:hypothetical protein